MLHNSPNPAIRALTDWWEEMGVDVDRAEIDALMAGLAQRKASDNQGAVPAQQKVEAPINGGQTRRRKNKTQSVQDWVEDARALAAQAQSIEALKAAIESYEGCPLKKLCEKTVVCDGTVGAPIMVIGEGPGGQEDRLGLPFVGKAGQLLDKMLAAIELDRKRNVFITNVNYWRPPGNRNPEKDELAVCRPFVDRMIELAAPKLILAMGGVAAKSLLDTKTGIMRLRGSEHTFHTLSGLSIPLIPMFHPAYLLRRSPDKSRSWRDLLLAQARLEEMGVPL